VVRYLVAVGALTFALPSFARAQAPIAPDAIASRLAYFSPQRAFALSSDGKAAQARLAAIETETSQQLAARTATLTQMQNALQQNASVLGESALRQRELEVERFQIDTKRFLEDAQARFLGVQRDLENNFLAKLRPALDSLSKERGFLFVLNEDSGLLAWANPALDITPDIVRRLNQP
jgi:Skp family chaperone for outer membrane proteins